MPFAYRAGLGAMMGDAQEVRGVLGGAARRRSSAANRSLEPQSGLRAAANRSRPSTGGMVRVLADTEVLIPIHAPKSARTCLRQPVPAANPPPPQARGSIARISEDPYRVFHEFPPPPTRSEISGWVVDRGSCGVG